MVRIECYCDDKKLSDVVRVLSGLLLEPPIITYVINAAVKNGKVQADKQAGNITELATHYLRSKKLASVTTKDLGAWLTTVGRSVMSANYLATNLKKARVLKPIKGRPGVFDVIPTK